MTATFATDLDLVDPTTVEIVGPSYPVAQWLNGDPKLAAVGGVAHTGGLILPQRHLPDDFTPPAGWTRTSVAFASGKSELVLACPKPRLALIRARFRWFVNLNGVTTYYPRAAYAANSGMRGHLQVLAAPRGFDFPIVVTFKGKASQSFELLMRDGLQRIDEAAQRILKSPTAGAPPRRFPRFAFYLAFTSSAHTKVGTKGQESIVTPPASEVPNTITEDYLSKIYIGRDRLLDLQRVYHDSAAWSAEWDRPGAEGEPDDVPPDDVDPETGEILSDPRPAAPAAAAPAAASPAAAAAPATSAATTKVAQAVKGPAVLRCKPSLLLPHLKTLGEFDRRYVSVAGQLNFLMDAAHCGFTEVTTTNLEVVVEAIGKAHPAAAQPLEQF